MTKTPFLLSMEEFEATCAMKCANSCYVWSKDGMLLRVDIHRGVTTQSTPGYPNENHLGYMKRTTFVEERIKTVEISLEELGNQDVVYDEWGNFVCTKPCSNAERPGEIYILTKNPVAPYLNTDTPLVGQQVPEYEEIPLKRVWDAMSPESYSKVFTHIVGLKMKGELMGLYNGKISVQMYFSDKGIPEQYHNMTADMRCGEPHKANAFYGPEDNIVGALVNVKGDMELYATLWNVINLLGVHEIGHKVCSWCNDDFDAHYLLYLRQMEDKTWGRTTRSFKIQEVDNFELYYDKNRFKYQTKSDTLNILRRNGLYRATSPKADKGGRIFVNDPDSLFYEDVSKGIKSLRELNRRNPFK